MPHQQAKILLCIDLCSPLTTTPPGEDAPGFERAFAEARMLMEVAYAGASKRVLIKLTRKLDPSRAKSRAGWCAKQKPPV